jgi:hypothetical protein
MQTYCLTLVCYSFPGENLGIGCCQFQMPNLGPSGSPSNSQHKAISLLLPDLGTQPRNHEFTSFPSEFWPVGFLSLGDKVVIWSQGRKMGL